MSSLSITCKSHHLPEVNSHFTVVLQDGPDEERCPGRGTALIPVGTVPHQHFIDVLKVRQDTGLASEGVKSEQSFLLLITEF